MADDPPRPPWPSRLTPMSSREVITQGAREIAVDDFIDNHLQERPRTVPEMSAYQGDAEPPTHRRVEPGAAPAGPPPVPGWAPAGPPRPGNAAKPYQPSVKTIPMQAVAPAPRPAPPPAPPPPTSHDDEGGGRTMMLTPEQAEAAARALAAATAAASPQQAQPPAQPHAPPPTGLSGTIMMDAIGPAPPMPPAVPPPAPPAPQMPSYIAPAVPQGPAPQAQIAQPGYEAFPEPAYAPPKKGNAGILIGVGIAFAVVAGLGIAYWQGLIHLPMGSSPSSRTTAASTSESTSAPAPAATSAAAAPGSSAAPAASASASSAPPVSAPASGDEKPLLSFEAALTVTSSIDAEVVVQGQSVGRTNKRLVTRCGPKNVRLRVEGKGWVSPGQPVQITCMQSTSVTIEPSS